MTLARLPHLSRAALLAALAPLALACATPCERVGSSHLAFRKATRPVDPSEARPLPGARSSGEAPAARDGGAHLSVSIPYELIDAMIAKQLAQVPKLKLPLGAVAGVSLGTVTLGVDAVRTRAAPPGELGFRIVIGLRQAKREVLSVDLDARVRPRLDARAGTLAVALAGRDVVALEPSLSPKARKQLGEWIWAQLPQPAKLVVDRGTVTALAGDLAEQLMRDAARRVERELLDELGELARFEFDLPPELPLRSLELRAGDRYLDLDLRTALRVEVGLGPERARVEGLHPNLVQVRVAGDAIAALANHAIREGRLPERWTLAGEPAEPGDPDAVVAGVGWAEGVADPIEIHLWKLAGDCAYVVLRGEPHLRVVSPARGAAPELELGATEAKVERVVGSAKIRAGLLFSRAARRGLELVERTTAATQIEIAGTPMTASIRAAEVHGDEVVLGLSLSP